MFLHHGELYKLFIEWPGGGGERLPSYVRRVVQDPVTKVFSAQVWEPESRTSGSTRARVRARIPLSMNAISA